MHNYIQQYFNGRVATLKPVYLSEVRNHTHIGCISQIGPFYKHKEALLAGI